MAHLEGAEDATKISSISRFVAGGIGGVVSQSVPPDGVVHKLLVAYLIPLLVQVFHISHRYPEIVSCAVDTPWPRRFS